VFCSKYFVRGTFFVSLFFAYGLVPGGQFFFSHLRFLVCILLLRFFPNLRHPCFSLPSVRSQFFWLWGLLDFDWLVFSRLSFPLSPRCYPTSSRPVFILNILTPVLLESDIPFLHSEASTSRGIPLQPLCGKSNRGLRPWT